MAKELDVPVLSLSQMSREVEKRGGRPKLSDLRGSGALEQDADVVLFISRSKKAEKTELILEKHRSGPTGVVEVEFRPEISQFAEIGEVEEDCLP
jgi:replicative DNA helicase